MILIVKIRGRNDVIKLLGGSNADIVKAAFGYGAKVISSGTDINSLTTHGSYRSPTEAITTSLVNAPFAHGAFLLWNIRFASPNASDYLETSVQVAFSSITNITSKYGIKARKCAGGVWSLGRIL